MTSSKSAIVPTKPEPNSIGGIGIAGNQQLTERVILVDRDYVADQIADRLEVDPVDDAEAAVDRVFDRFKELWERDHMYDRIGDMITEAYEQSTG